MDGRLQRRVQRYGWDRAAGVYQQYWWRQLKPAQDRMLATAGLHPGARVLDVAAGTGLVTFAAAEAVGPTGSVTATDISEAMVTTLREQANARGLPQVSVARMDAEDLRVPRGSFDVALCALGLMYVPDPVEALRQMRQALRPAGRVAIAVWGERAGCGWAEIFPIVERRVASEVCPLFFQLGTGDALPLAMDMAGFLAVETVRLSTTLEYASDVDACGAAFEGGPVALAYSRFNDRTREGAHAEYLASLDAYRAGAGYRVPGEFVLGWGTAPT